MGFQQELFEVDLERGEGSGTFVRRPSRSRAESSVTCALVLLLLAAASPDGSTVGRGLVVAALFASIHGTIGLLKRRSNRTVIALLCACWILYAARATRVHTRVRYVGVAKVVTLHDAAVRAKLIAPDTPSDVLPPHVAAANAATVADEHDSTLQQLSGRAVRNGARTGTLEAPDAAQVPFT